MIRFALRHIPDSVIIIAKHTNRLCNRLFTYLPTLSYALEADERVRILFQYEGYRGFFPNLEDGDVVSTRLYTRSLKGGFRSKVLYAMATALDKVVHLIIKPGEAMPLHKPLGVLFGHKYRLARHDNAYVDNHREALKRLFTPAADVLRSIEADFAKASTEGDIVIGVHLRRGDYAKYRNGQFYYPDDVYTRHMQSLAEQLAGQNIDQNVIFLLCSDEPVNADHFSQFRTFRMSGGGILHDLYGLARCQYIIGAPSSFSEWASFYGNVPLYHIRKADKSLTLNDFRVCLRQSEWE